MSKRRMAGWRPLTVENQQTPPVAQIEPDQETTPEPVAEQSAAAPAEPAVQDAAVRPRRMAGWQPLSATESSATEPSAVEPGVADPVVEEPVAAPAAPSGPIQDPDVPRRRMAGWQPLTVAHDAPAAAAVASSKITPEPKASPSPQSVTAEHETPALPRRRMAGWQPLQVEHPGTVAPAAESTPTPEPAPTPEPTPASAATETPAAQSVPEPEVTMPDVVTPPPAEQPAATKTVEKDVVKEPSKFRKLFITLGIVVVAAVALVFVAQWLRNLDPVANFIATYNGTPTHPDGVEPGVPGWVGWQHFLNFFIIVMVLRSGFIIRNQQRPEAYWTPKQGGLYSPKHNAPQKVSIQQWIHQTFNILWVANGLIFYVMVFVTGHWMRIVPTNWDIFPNIVSAGIQYVSLDWPEEQSWVYYNALQLLTYFITIFIAAPIAIISGLRLSTWWPQHAKRVNKAFSLEAARKIHFVTMLYFVVFIIVHLLLVFTTGALANLNMMFTARNADDWLGIGVFALSVAVTVGIAWLIKPIFISPIAEKTGQVSTR